MTLRRTTPNAGGRAASMNRRQFSAAVMAGSTGIVVGVVGRSDAAAQTGDNPALETWTPRKQFVPSTLAVSTPDPAKLAWAIWGGYGLSAPNNYDTDETFCEAILADWERRRSAYVWRYASSSGPQVYVLPARFVFAHPPFLPDFPAGYYRLDPACEVDNSRSCIPPNAFYRILPRESVDEYPPGEIAPTVTPLGSHQLEWIPRGD